MSIVVKFQGKCRVCGRTVKEGEPAKFGQGGLTHQGCGGSQKTLSKAPNRGRCPKCSCVLVQDSAGFYCPNCNWD